MKSPEVHVYRDGTACMVYKVHIQDGSENTCSTTPHNHVLAYIIYSCKLFYCSYNYTYVGVVMWDCVVFSPHHAP